MSFDRSRCWRASLKSRSLSMLESESEEKERMPRAPIDTLTKRTWRYLVDREWTGDLYLCALRSLLTFELLANPTVNSRR